MPAKSPRTFRWISDEIYLDWEPLRRGSDFTFGFDGRVTDEVARKPSCFVNEMQRYYEALTQEIMQIILI